MCWASGYGGCWFFVCLLVSVSVSVFVSVFVFVVLFWFRRGVCLVFGAGF